MVEKKLINKKITKNGHDHKRIERVHAKTASENVAEVKKENVSKEKVKKVEVKESFVKKMLLFIKENSTFILLSIILILSILTIYAFSTRGSVDYQKNQPIEFKDEITFYYIKPPIDCTYCSNDYLDMVKATHEQLFIQITDLKVNNIVYEYDSKEAQKLIQEYSLKRVPAVLLEAKADNLAFQGIDGYEEYFELQSEDKYKLSDLILNGNGQEMLYELDPLAREEIESEYEEKRQQALELLGTSDKPKIDFFVMSFCPYGIQAEDGILEALELLGDTVDYKPWFVMNSATSNLGNCKLIGEKYYCSLHGVEELEENIRQLCIFEDQEDKFLSYIGQIRDQYYEQTLSYTNINSKWESIALDNGIDINKVKSCFNDNERVQSMLDDQILVGNFMGVSGSPTVFVDGVLAGGGRTGEYYKNTLCSYFDAESRPSQCGSQLSDTGASAAGSC